MLLESAISLAFCLKLTFKLVTFSKSYARKQKWVFFSEHSVVFAARCYASAAYVVMWCLSVRVSVTFVHSVKRNKHIFNIFHHRVATPF